MPRLSFFRVAFGAFLAGALLGIDASGAALFEREVSAKPPLSASTQPLLLNSSSIGASAVISYQALTDGLSSALPRTFDASGRQKVCADLSEAVQQTIQKKIGGNVGKFVGRAARRAGQSA
jgi:hypothetical protein